MWKPTNLAEAMLPIFIINSLFCHGIIQFPGLKESKIYYSFLYSVATAIIFFASLIYVLWKWLDHFLSDITKSAYYMNVGLITFAMIVNVIVGWVNKNKSWRIVSRTVKADEKLKKLGVPVNASREFFFIIATVIFWLFFASFLDTSRILATQKNLDVSDKIMPTIVLQHGMHVNFLIDIIFCYSIKHMKIRFKRINRILLDIFNLQDNDSKYKKKSNSYKWAISRGINFEKDYTKILHDVRQIHLELGILCRELMKIYGLPIMSTMTTVYLNIISIILVIYRILVNTQEANFDKVTVLASLFLWIIVFSSRVFIINYICAKCVSEWKNTGEIIHRLEFESKHIEFQEEIKQFSIQILQNPVKFSPCGLFDLDYYFLRDFTGALTAQVLLSIQTYRLTSE